MKIIYESFDGIQFENEIDCIEHEWRKDHPLLNNILMYEDGGTPITNPLDEDNYFKCVKVIVHSDEEVATLHDLVEFTGFEEYERIDSPGIWRWKREDENPNWRFFKE
jgi:hypothetical protein